MKLPFPLSIEQTSQMDYSKSPECLITISRVRVFGLLVFVKKEVSKQLRDIPLVKD